MGIKIIDYDKVDKQIPPTITICLVEKNGKEVNDLCCFLKKWMQYKSKYKQSTWGQ